MPARLQRSLEALLLLLLGILLGSRLWTGQITWYINVRFLPLTLLGTVGLLMMARVRYVDRAEQEAGAESRHHAHSHPRAALKQLGPAAARRPEQAPHPEPAAGGSGLAAAVPESSPKATSTWGLLIFLLPLLIGWAVPHRPLGSDALAHRGFSTAAPLRAAADRSAPSEPDSDERTILDWLRSFELAADPQAQQGLPAEVIGFAYHDPRLGPGQVLLGRFALTCCVADAAAIGLIVEGAGAESTLDNAWYRVRGTIYLTELQGQPIPIIRAEQLEPVPMPEEPYLYN